MAHVDRLSLALNDAERAALSLLESLRTAKALVPKVTAEAVQQEKLDATHHVRITSPEALQLQRQSHAVRASGSPSLRAVLSSPPPLKEARREFTQTLDAAATLSPHASLSASQGMRSRPQPRRLDDRASLPAAVNTLRGAPDRVVVLAPAHRSPLVKPQSFAPLQTGRLGASQSIAAGSPSRLTVGELTTGASIAPARGPGSVGTASAVTRITGIEESGPARAVHDLHATSERAYTRAEEAVKEALSVAASISTRRANVPAQARDAERLTSDLGAIVFPPPSSQWLHDGLNTRRDSQLTVDSLSRPAPSDMLQDVRGASDKHVGIASMQAMYAPLSCDSAAEGDSDVHDARAALPEATATIENPAHRTASSGRTATVQDDNAKSLAAISKQDYADQRTLIPVRRSSINVNASDNASSRELEPESTSAAGAHELAILQLLGALKSI